MLGCLLSSLRFKLQECLSHESLHRLILDLQDDLLTSQVSFYLLPLCNSLWGPFGSFPGQFHQMSGHLLCCYRPIFNECRSPFSGPPGVFWGTLRFWPTLPVRRKSIVSLHKGSHWPLPPRAGRPSGRLRAGWSSSPTLSPAAPRSPTNGMAVTSTAPPSGAGPTIPLAYGALPAAARAGG